MQLVPYADTRADLELTRELETDPVVMRELGGAVPEDEIPAIHQRRAAAVEGGDWWLKITLDDGDAAGTIGIWPCGWENAPGHEVGWMVLPRFQGRGLARQALGLVLERARLDPEIALLHAFPATGNAASNALCRRQGFELVGEIDGEYAGRELHCNHWRLRL